MICKTRSSFVSDIEASGQRQSVKPISHTHTHAQTHAHTHIYTLIHTRTHARAHTHKELSISRSITPLPRRDSCRSPRPVVREYLSWLLSLPFQAYITCPHATRILLFLIRVIRTLPKYLVDIACTCVVEGPFTSVQNVREHILTEHINECTSFAF